MEKLKNVFKSGINYTNYGKANFASKILCFKEVNEELAKKLMNDTNLAEKLGLNIDVKKVNGINKYVHIQFQQDVETLEKIYDILIGSRLKGVNGEKRKGEVIEKIGEDFYNVEMEQVERNRESIDYDIVLPLAYYLVIMDVARTLLWDKYKQIKEELISYYKKSIYSNKRFFAFIPGIYMEQAICIVGLIIKCREQNHKEIYNDIISAIRRCNSKMINYIKKLHVVTGESMQQVVMDIALYENDVLVQSSGMIVALIVAEAFGKEIIIDYDMGKYIMVAMKYLNQFYVDIGKEEISIKVSEKNMCFLEKFKEEFSVNNCIHSVMYGKEHDPSVTKLSEKIYYSYGISPRKFGKYLLSENEVYELVDLSSTWNNKKYFMALQIAVLCKYIGDLECYIEDRIVNNFDVELYDLKEKEGEILKKEKDLEIKMKDCETKIEQLEKRNMELEAELEKQKKVIEEKNKKHENEKAELIRLREYIYKSSEMEENLDDKIIDFEKIRNFWVVQSVVLIGGHENWQQKIKSVFPTWKYVTASQTTFSPDMVSDKKYIICNTDVLAHSVYYKVIANKSANQSLLYTHGRNIEKFLIELEGQKDCRRATQDLDLDSPNSHKATRYL